MKTHRKDSRPATEKDAETEKGNRSARSKELATTLQGEVDEAQWSWLKPHSIRDSVILISPELSLVDVGISLAVDDAAAVQAWMEQGKIMKPSAEQILTWDAHPSKRFQILVIQPYVLAQIITLH